MEKDFDREADTYLGLIWSQDDLQETFNSKQWYKSNPLLYLKSQKDVLMQGLTDKKNSDILTGTLDDFKNKNLNMWLSSSTDSFLKLADVESSIVPSFDITGRDVYVGFDYSLASDNTAFGFVFPYLDENNQPKYYILQHSFIPTNHAGSIEAKERQDGINYRELQNKGFCTITSHEQGLINMDQVYNWLLNFVEENNLNVIYFGYDRFGSYQVKNLIGSLLNNKPKWMIQDVQQKTSVLSDPTKFLQEMFITHKVTRLDDKVMEKALLNAVIKADKIGIQVDKYQATMKIDVVDALIDALCQAMYHFDDSSEYNSDLAKFGRMDEQEQLKKGIANGAIDPEFINDI